MKKLFLLFCVLLGSSPSALAEYDGPLLSVALGTKLGNRWIVRGATFYDALYVSPVLYVGAFDRRLEFFGNSLEFNDFLVDGVLRGRTRIGLLGDDPSIVFGEPKGFRNSRDSALELSGTLQWFIPNWETYWGQFDLVLAKSVKAHFGVYGEATARVTLAKFWRENGKARVQPQAFVRLGWGDTQHNQYLYGSSALNPVGAGFNHLAAGLMVVAPARIDPHYPVLEMGYYRVLGNARNGALVADQPQGFGIVATVAFQVFNIK